MSFLGNPLISADRSMNFLGIPRISSDKSMNYLGIPRIFLTILWICSDRSTTFLGIPRISSDKSMKFLGIPRIFLTIFWICSDRFTTFLGIPRISSDESMNFPGIPRISFNNEKDPYGQQLEMGLSILMGIYQDSWSQIVFSRMVTLVPSRLMRVALCPPCLPSVSVLLVGVGSTRGAY